MSVFTQIIRREIDADIVFEDELCIVIHDHAPQAPLHLLVIPKKPLKSLAQAQKEDLPLLGHLNWVAAQVAKSQGCSDFRLISNTGSGAGQTVFHLHYHVLGDASGQTTRSEQGL